MRHPHPGRRRRLPRRRPPLRHRPVPRPRPRPVGRRAPRRRRRRHPRDPPAAAGQPRLFAIPTGVALVGLGYSLWREQRTAAPCPCPARSARRSTRPAPSDHPRGRLHHSVDPVDSVDRVGAVRAGRPRRGPRDRRLAAPGRGGRWSAPDAREPAHHRLTGARGRAHRQRARRTPSSAPSSSPPRCGAAGPAGTGRPDGSWWCSAWRWRSRRCG